MFLVITIFLITIIIYSVDVNLFDDVIENIKLRQYGEPIGNDGLINNEYFAISLSNDNPKKNTKGINAAIEYAFKHNIEYIKLQNGVYIVDGQEKNNNINEGNKPKGIILKSNITLDLNGSTIIQERNGYKNYANISVTNVENVTIMNGTLKGDKDEHDYSTIQSSHEWGFGIDIRSSKNIHVKNLEITDMTGDGIFLMSYFNTENITDNVVISNCNIHDCRRQGISIIHAKNVTINNNEIRNIEGTAPGLAIDIEPEDASQSIENVMIKGNKLYNGIAMQRKSKNITIEENEIFNSEIKSYQIDDNIKIIGNTLKKTGINMRLYTQNGAKVKIEKNIIEDARIYVVNIDNLNINSNNTNDSIVVVSSSGAIYNNKIESVEEKDYGICTTVLQNDKNYILYEVNNKINDEYKNKVLNYNSYCIEISRDSIKMLEYLSIFLEEKENG